MKRPRENEAPKKNIYDFGVSNQVSEIPTIGGNIQQQNNNSRI